jgi:hypothetical protein
MADEAAAGLTILVVDYEPAWACALGVVGKAGRDPTDG